MSIVRNAPPRDDASSSQQTDEKQTQQKKQKQKSPLLVFSFNFVPYSAASIVVDLQISNPPTPSNPKVEGSIPNPALLNWRSASLANTMSRILSAYTAFVCDGAPDDSKKLKSSFLHALTAQFEFLDVLLWHRNGRVGVPPRFDAARDCYNNAGGEMFTESQIIKVLKHCHDRIKANTPNDANTFLCNFEYEDIEKFVDSDVWEKMKPYSESLQYSYLSKGTPNGFGEPLSAQEIRKLLPKRGLVPPSPQSSKIRALLASVELARGPPAQDVKPEKLSDPEVLPLHVRTAILSRIQTAIDEATSSQKRKTSIFEAIEYGSLACDVGVEDSDMDVGFVVRSEGVEHSDILSMKDIFFERLLSTKPNSCLSCQRKKILSSPEKTTNLAPDEQNSVFGSHEQHESVAPKSSVPEQFYFTMKEGEKKWHVDVDVNFDKKNYIELLQSKIDILKTHAKAKPLFRDIRRWAGSRSLIGGKCRSLNSFSLMLMVINYLQQRDVSNLGDAVDLFFDSDAWSRILSYVDSRTVLGLVDYNAMPSNVAETIAPALAAHYNALIRSLGPVSSLRGFSSVFYEYASHIDFRKWCEKLNPDSSILFGSAGGATARVKAFRDEDDRDEDDRDEDDRDEDDRYEDDRDEDDAPTQAWNIFVCDEEFDCIIKCHQEMVEHYASKIDDAIVAASEAEKIATEDAKISDVYEAANMTASAARSAVKANFDLFTIEQMGEHIQGLVEEARPTIRHMVNIRQTREDDGVLNQVYDIVKRVELLCDQFENSQKKGESARKTESSVYEIATKAANRAAASYDITLKRKASEVKGYAFAAKHAAQSAAGAMSDTMDVSSIRVAARTAEICAGYAEAVAKMAEAVADITEFPFDGYFRSARHVMDNYDSVKSDADQARAYANEATLSAEHARAAAEEAARMCSDFTETVTVFPDRADVTEIETDSADQKLRGELFRGFFEFYGTDFVPSLHAVSVRGGCLMWTESVPLKGALVVLDPIGPPRNIASCVSKDGVVSFFTEIARANVLIRAGYPFSYICRPLKASKEEYTNAWMSPFLAHENSPDSVRHWIQLASEASALFNSQSAQNEALTIASFQEKRSGLLKLVLGDVEPQFETQPSMSSESEAYILVEMMTLMKSTFGPEAYSNICIAPRVWSKGKDPAKDPAKESGKHAQFAMLREVAVFFYEKHVGQNIVL